MPSLDDQVIPARPGENLRRDDASIRAGVLRLKHQLGHITLSDELIEDEHPSTCAILAQWFPELHLTARGRWPWETRYQLPPETPERAAHTQAVLSIEYAAVQAGIRRALDAVADMNLRLPGEGDGTDTPPQPKTDGAVGLNEAERRVLAQVKADAGVGESA